MTPIYVSIQQEATGKNIRRLMKAVGIRVKDVQTACGFEQPQAVYKWLNGQSLPSLDNLLILSILLHTSMEGILVTNGEALLPFCGRIKPLRMRLHKALDVSLSWR